MSNCIVADSATSASGKDVHAPIYFGIRFIHPDGRHVPPMSVSAAAQQEPAVFQSFAKEVSHEAERLKAEQLEIDTVGLLVKLQSQESLIPCGYFALKLSPICNTLAIHSKSTVFGTRTERKTTKSTKFFRPRNFRVLRAISCHSCSKRYTI